MELYNKLSKDMMDAMKSHDKDTLSTLRLLKSAIDLQKINNKLTEITDELVIEVASKQVKQHKESITEFRNAGRDDLADNLEREIKIISNYLPEQLSKEEIIKEKAKKQYTITAILEELFRKNIYISFSCIFSGFNKNISNNN